MILNMLQTQLGHMPIIMHLLNNGHISFTPQFRDITITDYSNKLEVFINNFGIEIVDTDSKDEEKYTFGTAIDYKTKPLLLEWLKSFNLKFDMFL